MYFLVNLAVSDFLVGIVTLLTSVASLTFEAIGRENFTISHISRISFSFRPGTASVLNLAVLFIDRYLAVKNPARYREHSKFKTAYWCPVSHGSLQFQFQRCST